MRIQVWSQICILYLICFHKCSGPSLWWCPDCRKEWPFGVHCWPFFGVIWEYAVSTGKLPCYKRKATKLAVTDPKAGITSVMEVLPKEMENGMTTHLFQYCQLGLILGQIAVGALFHGPTRRFLTSSSPKDSLEMLRFGLGTFCSLAHHFSPLSPRNAGSGVGVFQIVECHWA